MKMKKEKGKMKNKKEKMKPIVPVGLTSRE
jgi:hypothetical protein